MYAAGPTSSSYVENDSTFVRSRATTTVHDSGVAVAHQWSNVVLRRRMPCRSPDSIHSMARRAHMPFPLLHCQLHTCGLQWNATMLEPGLALALPALLVLAVENVEHCTVCNSVSPRATQSATFCCKCMDGPAGAALSLVTCHFVKHATCHAPSFVRQQTSHLVFVGDLVFRSPPCR